MNKMYTRMLAILLAIALTFSYVPATYTHTYAATKKVKLSKKKVKIVAGKKKTVKLKNVTKKVKWKVVKGKKVVSIKKKGKLKNKIVIKAKKAGKAKIRAKYNGKKYFIKVTVRKAKFPAELPTVPDLENVTTAVATTTTVDVTTSAETTAASNETTAEPTVGPTDVPTQAPTTVAPTQAPTTVAPTQASTTVAPTQAPTTVAPTQAPTTVAPTQAPTTAAPTQAPTTTKPVVTTTVAPTTTVKPTTATPTTTADPNKPAAPAGFMYAGNANLPYYFAWAKAEGVTYNFYVNDNLVAGGIDAGLYNCSSEYFTKAGEYIISLAAVKNGYESDKVSVKFTVTAENIGTTAAPTQAPTVAPTQAPTTVAPTTVYIPSNNKGMIPGFTQWTYPEGSSVTDGKAVINLPAITGGNNYDYQLVYNGLTLKDNTTYKITAKFTSTDARKFQVLLQSDGNNGGNWEYANSSAAFTVEANKEYTYQTNVTITSAKNKYLLGLMMGFVDNTATQAATVTVTEMSLEEVGTVTTQAPTQAPTTVAPTQAPTTQAPQTHVIKNPGVQTEAADPQVANDISLAPYFDSIDTTISSTTGNPPNEGVDKLFDGNVNTKYFAGVYPSITIAWKMKRAVTLTRYTFVLAGDAATYTYRNPHCWGVYGSMDGVNWTTLSNVTDGPIEHKNHGEFTFTCDKQVSCQYFMLVINDSGVDGKLYLGSQLSEMMLYGNVDRITENTGDNVSDQVKGINAGQTSVAGFNASEGVNNLFDGNLGTKLFSTSQAPSTIAWTMNQDTTLYSYTITTANDNATYTNRTIKSWNLYGSTNGNDWTLIDTVTESGMADANYAEYTYLVDKVGNYSQYKMEITGLYGNSFQISEIKLNGTSVAYGEYLALFVGDWDKVTAPGYQQALHDAFYDVYPRQYARWGTGSEPKKIFVRADKGYDGVAYTSGSSIVIAVDWMNNNPRGIGYFTHELTHAAQQYGNIDSSWWVENMANYGGFRYYHWASEDTAQVYYANDTSLQDWNYEPYGNNKWFFAYMDSRYPTTKVNGQVKYGLIDSLNHLLKDNKGTRYNDNPKDVNSEWNKVVKNVTGYDCIESLRLRFVEELKNGTWNFTGFGEYADNWITTDLPGVPNINYPKFVGKTHGNTTAQKLGTAVTSGTNLFQGAKIVSYSGFTNNNEAPEYVIDGNLSTKWCATAGSVENQAYALSGAQHFVKIDLGSSKTFNTYTIYNTQSKEGFGNVTEWEVLISNDGTNWKSVDYQVNQNDAISSFNIGSQTARYIVFKVFNSDNNGPGTIRLYELQLYNR